MTLTPVREQCLVKSTSEVQILSADKNSFINPQLGLSYDEKLMSERKGLKE